MNAKHLSKSNLWYTPQWLIDKSRAVLGDSIDFDPASDAFGNNRVEATRYWQEGALEKAWPKVETVFLNPPGGKVGRDSQAALFWKKLMSEWAAGAFEQAIFIGFSIEIFQTGQNGIVPPQAFPFCVPSKRFGFDTTDGPTDNPSHVPVIVYVPPSENTQDCIRTFSQAFYDVGYVHSL
jgi:hypothetical protein